MQHAPQNEGHPEAKKDHTIHLVTAEMGAPGSPAYNYVCFYNAKGQKAMSIHSMPMMRGDNTLTLRAVLAPAGTKNLPQDHFNIVQQMEIFKGSGEEYLRKLLCAADAMKFINAQNLNYNQEDQNGDSPNSVAHTVVTAMGLEFPEEATQFWAPGHERIILPLNWRSAYATTH